MSNRHEWMTNFVPITLRSWQVAIVDDIHHLSPWNWRCTHLEKCRCNLEEGDAKRSYLHSPSHEKFVLSEASNNSRGCDFL